MDPREERIDMLSEALMKMEIEHEQERIRWQSKLSEDNAIILKMDREQQALLRAWHLEREHQKIVFENMTESLHRLMKIASAIIKK